MQVARTFNATNWKFAIGKVFLILAGVTMELAIKLMLSILYSLLTESRKQNR